MVALAHTDLVLVALLAGTVSTASGCSSDDAGSADADGTASSGAGTSATELAADGSDAETAALREDGEACGDSTECVNQCYFLPMIGGTCGECASDSDCSGGCTPPGILEPTPPACNDGSLASACETEAACQAPLSCPVVVDTGFVPIRGCSECTSSDDCPAEQLCNLELDLSGFAGHRACIVPASAEVGRTCDEDLACASGICATANVLMAPVGVCSDCREDADCSAGQICTVASFDMASFSVVPGRCT